MRTLLIVAALLAASPALADPQNDPAFLQKAITALQVQRNAAMDAAAAQEAKSALLQEQLSQAQSRIKELEKVPAGPSKP